MSATTWRHKRAVVVLLVLGSLCSGTACDRAAAPPSEASPAAAASSPTNSAAPAADGEPVAARAVEAHEPRPANRLARETSPYLLLHAHNPVDWYPWGPEALERARRENKPIFLSIGYSSCHWCHVMERESFLDEEIAALLNEHFVCIKVDREERPDIDEIYMTSLQLYHRLTGSDQGGGWPLTMFLTPDARPFFGGTYFPPRTRDGRTGLLSVLVQVRDVWRDAPEKIQADGEHLAEVVKSALRERSLAGAALPSAELAEEVEEALADEFDAEYGGFGFNPDNPRQPKFPEPPNLMLLLDRARRERSADADESQEPSEAEQMLTKTLDAMADGGIYDHLGGGFHRYSTDRYWLVPHFEKMLYDNAQLATVYAEAYALTGRAGYREVVDELLAMIARDFTSPAGAFYAALDAESEGREGGYHAWRRGDVEAALSPEEYEPFAAVYGLDGEPNFEEDEYVLHVAVPSDDAAQQLGLDPQEAQSRLAKARGKLLALRDERPRPLADTKILADWNGLMIAGYADAGRIFDNDDYVVTARRAAEFVLANLKDKQDRLTHTYAGGAAKGGAYLDDYAFLVAGLLALHRTTGEQPWLDEADRLTAEQIELFWDREGGGFFFTAGDHEELIARSRQGVDSAVPAGNAVAALNLIELAAALDKPEYRDYAERTIAAFGGLAARAPVAVPTLARARSALEVSRPPAEN